MGNKKMCPAILLWLLWWSCAGSAQVSVLTQHNDVSRTGQNLNETILNTSNVNANGFGKLFSIPVDGQIYAQPLYVPAVVIPGGGTHNVVYVATENDTVYAFDADNGNPLWQVSLGTAIPSTDICCSYLDMTPVIGITSTPVIDPGSGTIYVVAKTKDTTNNTYHQKLHALDITTGSEKFGGPVEIAATAPGTGAGSSAGMITFDPLYQGNRPGLLLLNGVIYLGFGSVGDFSNYHGWIMGYNATTLQQVGVFNATPNGSAGGVWAGGQGLAADPVTLNIYFMTGNGTFDANQPGGTDYGDSAVKLSTTGGLTAVDYFTPDNQNSLDTYDTDLGAGGPMLIPGTNLTVGGGKDGILRIINTTNMGQYSPSRNNDVQEFQATSGMIMGGVIYWNSPNNGPVIYLWGPGDYLKVFKFLGGLFQTTAVSQSTMTTPPGDSNAAPMSLSANGRQAGSGIIWAPNSYSGNANQQTVPEIFRALDASDVSKELWNSKQNATRDDVGNYAKFCPPTVANGKVYLATFSNQLLVYGLLNPAPTVTSISPTSGTTGGGTATTLTGTGFLSGAKVTFGGSAATNVTLTSSSSISATTPAYAAGPVDVTVTNTDGQSAVLASGYTYVAPRSSYLLTVSNTGTGAGVVTSSPGGISCGLTCSANFASGTAVSLTATPASGSTFAGWSGACSGTGACSVTMNAAASVTATFNSSAPPATVAWVQGHACTASSASSVNCSFMSNVTGGDLLVLGMSWTGSATATISDSLRASWSQAVSQTWSSGNAASRIYYLIAPASGAETITATFSPAASYPIIYLHEYSGVNTSAPLDVSSSASGISATPSSGAAPTSTAGDLIFGYADAVNLVVTAGSGFTPRETSNYAALSEDRIAASAGSNAASFTLAGSDTWVALMAAFRPAGGSTASYTLTVTDTGTGTGTVTSSPAGINCGATCSASFASGTVVSLTATPASGSTFAGWSGACSGTGACSVTMNAAASVTATFDTSPTSYTLTVTDTGTGTGTVTSSPAGINCGATCSASFASGTVVSLTATPASGSTFAGWSGACSGTGTCSVTMNAAASVTATFNVSLSSLTVSPTTVIGGNLSTGTVTLSGTAAADVLVTLSSNSPAATVPATVTVTAGTTSANFSIATTAVASSTSATISATYNGVTQTATLALSPSALSSLSLNPSTVVGGSPSTGTVTLTAPAPATGTTVQLSSSKTKVATVPSNVTVAAGATTATFTVTTKAVRSTTTVTISGTNAGVTESAVLTVTR